MGTIIPCNNAKAETGEYSSMLTGPLGLNTVPNARMDKAGTVRLGTSTLDPYVHGYIGFQLAKPLYINIRQSAEVSNINDDADRLYPGVDFKLRLLEEGPYNPAIVIGAQSAIGHKRTAGEYLAASKRYKGFDFTAGIGWGRFGSAAHTSNPLKSLSSHFGGQRPLDGERPNEITDWFTGENVGFFGGVEYFTPLDGLSLKADWGADRYEAENAAFNFGSPAPWSIGAAYQPAEWINLSLAAQGTDKVMGRITLKSLLQKWPDRDNKTSETSAAPFRPFRTGLTLPSQMQLSAEREDIALTEVSADIYEARARLLLDEHSSTPKQIGAAIKHMANHAGPAVEALTISPTIMGLRGPEITVMRSDFEKAAARKSGSPEEIWHNTEFETTTNIPPFNRLNRTREHLLGFHHSKLILENQASLAEEDSGVLYRSSIIAKTRGPKLFGLLDHGYGFRVNLKDNLNRIRDIRPRAILPVRSDVDVFAERTFALDESYLALTHSFTPDFHLSLMGGYLEEMYGGVGGELLYRPFGSRFAIGAEAFQTFKRDPFTDLNLGFNGDHVLTAHANAWYDLPHHDLTVNAKIGRFLAEDFGGRLGLTKRFENGAQLEGFITISDNQDFDLFGGTTHSYNGIRLSLPLGGVHRYAKGVELNTKIEPFGRDIGQDIQKPLALYDLTQPISFPHMKRHWNKIVPD